MDRIAIKMNDTELFSLVESRIKEIDVAGPELVKNAEKEYFAETIGFSRVLCDIWHTQNDVESINNDHKSSLEKLKEDNALLYSQITPENYKNSFTNPAYATEAFGLDGGRLLCAIAAELRGAIPAIYENRSEGLLCRLELILEVYSAYVCAGQDEEEVTADTLRQILFDYYHDYYEQELTDKITSQIIPSNKLLDISRSPEFFDERELYLTGEFVSDNELKMYKYLHELDANELQSMADTYTDGFIKGFEVTGRDLSIKSTAEVRFNIGFIPMLRYAARNLEKVGLSTNMMRAGSSIFTGRSVDKNGVFGGNPNPQFDIDHRNDLSLILSDELNTHRLEIMKKIYDEYKKQARDYAGPAVIDIFGEPDFTPEVKKEAADYTEDTRPLITSYASSAGRLINEYIPGDERSFTIIAYPVPSIGDQFEEIMQDTIRINTLDYVLYRDIQQRIIDALDTAEYVYICGKNDNKTQLYVHLHELANPNMQTNFENCVADVNIPVGEVFTSPVLQGTNGTLHVTRVFLNGLEYHDLRIEVKDGMIESYHCLEGDKLIEDNILYHHKSLPMGECAIGTNTTAYMVARKYNIESKFPILIAEKTGPHFAFGDTCYSHAEDLAVFNPDGKEIIARDNEKSLLRKTDPEKAYFNCHTDITIPYDELGEVSAIAADKSKKIIISDGRFVLPGCDELNKPLDEVL